MNLLTRLAAATFVLATMAACAGGGAGATASSGPSPSSAATSAPSAPGPSPTLQAPAGVAVPIRAAKEVPQACMDALLTGTLAPNELSGIGIEAGGESTPIEWPFGYTGLLAEGKLVLLDETGAMIGKVGDEVQLGGGFGNQFWHACAPVVVTKRS